MVAASRSYVFDAFALVAYFRNEPAAGRVSELLSAADQREVTLMLSVVNWGEVLYESQRRRGPEDVPHTMAVIDAMPIELVDADRELAYTAAQFKARGGLSYADCYAAALAQLNHAAVVTGDPEFHSVESVIRIEWLPQRPRQ